MKQRKVYVFETADELVRALDRKSPRIQTNGDDPMVPESVYPVLSEETVGVFLSGEGSEDFLIDPAVPQKDFIEALARACGIAKVHFT